jgi:carboxymethylenebutenolidase
MRTIALPIVVFSLTVISCAADGKAVSYKSGDERVQGLLYTPAGKAPFPGIVVVHEYWGLNDWIKEQSSKLAEQGYAALAVDLYRGKVADNPDLAHELMRGLPEDRAARDLHAAFEYLSSQPNVKKDRMGAIGWCMGGGHALLMAVQEPTLVADVINYGHLVTDSGQLKKINAAILGIFGGQDRGLPVEDVKRFEQQLKQSGKQVQIIIYPNAGHAFENPVNKAGYRPDDAADAWKHTLDFLASTLKK